MDAFIGMIMPFAGNFAPVNWALCNGQLLAISQNQALFAIIGTFYGGDGVSNFALPDLRGRTIVGVGQQPGGPSYGPGQVGGAASVTLNTSQLPSHTHTLNGIAIQGTAQSPANALLAVTEPGAGGTPSKSYAPLSAGTPVAMAPQAISAVGGSSPLPTIPPFQSVNYIICVNGLFPPRS
jgi:microcystin-dependent protein